MIEEGGGSKMQDGRGGESINDGRGLRKEGVQGLARREEDQKWLDKMEEDGHPRPFWR